MGWRKLPFRFRKKETEETEAENAQAKQSPEEMRQKELKEVIEQYNRETQDPDYYYLPDSWMARHLSGRNPGRVLNTSGKDPPCLVCRADVKKAREQQEEKLAKRATNSSLDGLSVADHEAYTPIQAGGDGPQSISEAINVQII